jgi:ABC-type branched-subunit amino acid transport system substrate-binding protein
MMRTCHLIGCAFQRLAWCMTLVGCTLWAQDSAYGEVLVGMSTPLSGPNAAYGHGLAQGVRAAMASFNEQGDGARIQLLLLDDAGQPEKAIVRISANVTGHFGHRDRRR